MTTLELLSLIAAGCTAGAVNAVAGGGTLLTFPVLLMCGTPPVMANATSTVGLVIGTAGGQDKCDWLVKELGFDAAVHYKAGNVFRPLRAAAPNGIDVYFDNTGGPVLDAAIALMNLKGRIACCGNVSQYDVEKPAPGPMTVPGLIVTKRLRMEGFIVMDFYDQRAEAERRLAQWIADGRIKAEVDILDGLERAPEALIGLFNGRNRGKMAVRV